jgi:cytochrome bd-type quinol oxidase subunit 2
VRPSHLVFLIVFSAIVSAVFATLLRDDQRARVRFALTAFAAFVLSALAVGWLMYPFPR